MTNEQKLLKLLKIAENNGWKDESQLICFIKEYNSFIENNHLCGTHLFRTKKFYSIDVLVLDFEYDSNANTICFIEALRKASNYENMDCLEDITSQWAFRPNSQRLDFLFNYFSHLLN